MSFKKTDYSKIAHKYDKNPVRAKQIDTEIKHLLQRKSHLKIVDLACGTGSYLKTQRDYYGASAIDWIGVDKSQEMLSIAREKNPGVTFILASADDIADIPEPLMEVDYIRNEFAFHHFIKKRQAIKNVHKMLAANGVLWMINIAPEYMQNYWVYHYFPAAIEEDRKRFVPADKLYLLLSDYGFDVKMNVSTHITPIDYTVILNEALNRDISQLNLINDEAYYKGIASIKKDMKKNKNLVIDISLLTVRAIKGQSN